MVRLGALAPAGCSRHRQRHLATAIHRARHALRRGDCGLAAGGSQDRPPARVWLCLGLIWLALLMWSLRLSARNDPAQLSVLAVLC